MSLVYVVCVCFQFQEERDDLQRKLVILQEDLEKSEAQADLQRKEAEEKASALDETERSVDMSSYSSFMMM